MLSYTLVVATTIFFVGFAFTPVLVRIAHKYQITIDQVSNSRKIHLEPTPRIGGVIVFTLFLLSSLVFFFSYQNHEVLSESHIDFLSTISCTVLVFILGLADDFNHITGIKKLLSQIIISFIFWYFTNGIKQIYLPVLGVIELHVSLSLILTIFWLVGITNTVNLIDGMDGLSSGIMIIASICLGIISYLTQAVWIYIILIFLVAGVLAFLPYNWHPSITFVGDSGAYFYGFLLAALSIQVCYNSQYPSLFYIPLIFLGLPIADTTYAIFRRITSGNHLFNGDKLHLHHQILNLGLTHRQTVISLYVISMLFTMIAISCYFLEPQTAFSIVLLLAVIVVLGVYWLREFSKNNEKS